jgi:Zn-dependent protease with chaperone function
MKNLSRNGAAAQRLVSAAAAAPLRRCVRMILSTSLILVCFCSSYAQSKPKSGSHSTRPGPNMSVEAKALLEEAIGVVCTQAKLDPKSSVAIDDMQARPSLPLQSPEAREGAERAQRLLPIAKDLVITALRQLGAEYGFQNSPKFNQRLRQAIARVNSVTRVRPDMESRDNASVYLSRPHVITFGTIFLAGLRSDEGMLSVLAHELTHIADGDNDSLRILVAAVGDKASDLTGLEIHGQRAEEISCDLIGAMVVRTYIVSTPGYESIARRLARSIQHNCVELDEGDEDHLSPRNTIRALLALNPGLVRELVNDRF